MPLGGSVAALTTVEDDLVRLEDINKGGVLHNLRMRFEHGHFQTKLGTILVSLNPFKWYPQLYTDEVADYYAGLRSVGGSLEAPPHIYAIAEAAYVRIA